MNLSYVKLSDVLNGSAILATNGSFIMTERELEARNKKFQKSLQSTEKIHKAIAKAVAI